MHPRRPPIPVIVILLLAIAVGGYYLLRSMNRGSNGTLTASGSIEATTVKLAPEIAGRVEEVFAREGQSVAAGSTMLRLDGSLLAAQREAANTAFESAIAAMNTAQTNYDIAMSNALSQRQAAQASEWRFSAPDEFNQPAWYFDRTEQLKAAQMEVAAALSALDAAQVELVRVTADLNNADFVKAETRLATAREAFLVADKVKTNADFAAEGGGLQRAADAAYNAALAELRTAQNEYNAMLNTQSARAVQDARGAVVVAEQRHDAASARLLSLQTGIDSPAVTLASRTLEQASAAVKQAEANLALLNVQSEKLSVMAPVDGVVLVRNVEPGEFLQPGAIAFTLGILSDMTITVYVPEDRYGEISLGQSAQVTVDSWPGQTFPATVILIADEAEYTPRNVQTVEGRSNTVYAIKLSVSDPEGRLKIGMPADVVFTPGE